MSSIILSTNEFNAEPVQTQTDILISDILQFPQIIDPSHPQVPPALRWQALKARYHDQLIRDGLTTGHFKLVDGKLDCSTFLRVEQFMGFIFEAFFVNEFNLDKLGKGRNAYLWCTRKKLLQSQHMEKWKAIGKGHIETKVTHLSYYEVGGNADIIFIRESILPGQWQQAMVHDTTIPAAIQVKAICGNERSEIIEPLREGKYRNVITCLRHPTGKHSYTTCIEIIRGMRNDSIIDHDTYIDLENRIYSPEHLGFDQYIVEQYRRYIENWYARRASTENFVVDAIGQEVKGFKRQGMLYVPE